ncbi:hypothetical protein [Salinarimonas soli]|uniref:Lipoprotein n=1 Tax=Salinarimonas soli TaxID=1638099 RepID=A0A5B2VSH7_9HYPH|nr:hypothetical protein [Salinarimonas soli]KAA2241212.1 hypothetical protein F0L46_04240 [Salinarimonas soli]
MRAVSVGSALAMVVALGGCVGAPKVESHGQWLAEATRTYAGETAPRVIAAAEAVLRHADPGDVTFDYRLGGFRAERKFLVYAVLAAAEGEDRWTFNASQSGRAVRASVFLTERARVHGTGGARQVNANRQQVGTFRLFYARIDYLLGLRPDWVTCREAPGKLGLPPDAAGTQGLCGLTLQGRDAPPPSLIPKMPKGAAEAAVAAAEPARDDGED